MGIYDRDYGRSSWDSGSRSHGGGMTTNSKLLLTMALVYFCQILTDGKLDAYGVLYSDWFTRPWLSYGLLSYGFFHSTQDLFHILFNGIALFFFGQAIEQRYGSKEYLAIFLSGVVFAGLTWSLSELVFQGRGTMLGASGGISTIMILFALNFPHQKVMIYGILPVPAWLLAILFIGQDMMGALSRSGDVAYTAHLGGALFGYLYFRYRWHLSSKLPSDWGKAFAGIFKSKPNLKVHHDNEDRAEEKDPDARQLDKILLKINEKGIDSLTRGEMKFLDKESHKRKNRKK